VREFWINLVPFFEEWQRIRVLPGRISDLQQRVKELDERCAALELQVETEDKQRQQHAKKLKLREREVEELQMMLRDANERNREERERNRVLLARHSASVRPTASRPFRRPYPLGNQLRKPNTVLRSSNSKKSLNPESESLSLPSCR
jgi:septal ring factor EnvC (AmiA/AmiB activator)